LLAKERTIVAMTTRCGDRSAAYHLGERQERMYRSGIRPNSIDARVILANATSSGTFSSVVRLTQIFLIRVYDRRGIWFQGASSFLSRAKYESEFPTTLVQS